MFTRAVEGRRQIRWGAVMAAATLLAAAGPVISPVAGPARGSEPFTGPLVEGVEKKRSKAKPKVAKVRPSQGSLSGGTKITVKGTGFTKVRKVLVGGVRAAKVKVVSARKLTAVVPPRAACSTGSVAVRVVTSAGKSKTAKKAKFTYTGVSATPMVAAGRFHTLALRSDGTVWAWGNNGASQLGDGGTTDATTPRKVKLPCATAVAAGTSHSVALLASGKVYGWGSSAVGQLGWGYLGTRHKPMAASTKIKFKAVEAFADRTFAIARNGDLYAWGWNSIYGELGVTGDGSIVKVPTKVSGISQVASVSSGAVHTVATTTSGQAWTWGYGDRLGLGAGQPSENITPRQITGLGTVKRLWATETGSYALLSNGKVYGWGSANPTNYHMGTGGAASTPLLPKPTGLVSPITSVAPGYSFRLAQDGSGNVWVWGNSYANDPLGDAAGSTSLSAPAKVAGLSSPSSMAVTLAAAFAVRSDGWLVAWGGNTNGRLGDGTTSDRSSPVTIMDLDPA